LEARLNEPSDLNSALLIHTAARTASWFPEYLTPENVTKIVGLLSSNTPVNPVVLPLLPYLVPFLHTPDHLEVIMSTAQTAILNGPLYIGQNQADNMYAAFEEILREPPPCIQALQGTREQLWNGVVESVKEILDLILIRTQESSARAVLRWNGRTRLPSGRRDRVLTLEISDAELPLEGGGFGIQGVQRPYSCAASWDM